MKKTNFMFLLGAITCLTISAPSFARNGGDDDDMIEIIRSNPDKINGSVLELMIEKKDLPEVVQQKLAAGESITLVFNDTDPKTGEKQTKHIIGLSLGIGAPLGGQIGVSYSPALAFTPGKNTFEVTGTIGSAIVLTSYELGVNIRIPYVNLLYGHIGYQFVKTNKFFKEKAANFVNGQIQDAIDGIEDPDAYEYAKDMELGFTPDDFHFSMGGGSLGLGIMWGPMRLEAGVNTMNVSRTANKLYDHLTGKLSGQIDSQLPPPPQDPHSIYPWEQAQYQQELAAYNQGKADFEAEKSAMISEGRTDMNSGINSFLGKSPGGLMPYVKLSFVIPIARISPKKSHQ